MQGLGLRASKFENTGQNIDPLPSLRILGSLQGHGQGIYYGLGMLCLGFGFRV